MAKITAMRGYSGSGKFTRAAEIAKETGAYIINRDRLRKMMFNEWWTGDPEHEDAVTVVEENAVEELIRSGRDVIVDATHLNATFLRKWARLATRLGAEFEVVDVHASHEECLRRAYRRWSQDMGTPEARYIDPKVIDQQFKRYSIEKWPTITAQPFVVEPAPEFDPDLPWAIIVDIDGTLAHIPEGGRSPFDYSRVSEDVIDRVIRDIVNAEYQYNEVLVVSGRDDTCLKETHKWLGKNGVLYDSLLMRPADAKDERGNKLSDYVVKYGLYNEHIRGKYNVRMVLDDRAQVVEMWRKLGLKCLQVAPGDF